MGPTGDNVFISYNFETGADIAREVAEALKAAGMDPWWQSSASCMVISAEFHPPSLKNDFLL